MADVRELVCITCPKGCRAEVWASDGEVKIRGKICRDGRAYLRQEFLEPLRVITSTVVVEESSAKRLPVRTARAVPKKVLPQCLAQIVKVRVQPPIAAGQTIIPNILDTGVDVIACEDIGEDG